MYFFTLLESFSQLHLILNFKLQPCINANLTIASLNFWKVTKVMPTCHLSFLKLSGHPLWVAFFSSSRIRYLLRHFHQGFPFHLLSPCIHFKAQYTTHSIWYLLMLIYCGLIFLKVCFLLPKFSNLFHCYIPFIITGLNIINLCVIGINCSCLTISILIS